MKLVVELSLQLDFLNNVTTTEYFFDDDGSGNLRIYSLVGNTRTYANSNAGTVDYANGLITIGSITITGVGFVDDASSSQNSCDCIT